MGFEGLVAYDYDSPSDTEAGPSTSNGGAGHQKNPNSNDKSSKSSSKGSSDGKRIVKSQVIIKRPAINHKNHHPRAHISDDLLRNDTDNDNLQAAEPSHSGSPMDVSSSSNRLGPSEEPQDELSRIRALIRPPPIPGVEDWGIPPETTEKCGPALQTQFTRFGNLKLDPAKPIHYNDNLMGNRTFRNPHLYTHLVDWVSVDERSTNFPKGLWDPADVRPEWFADQIEEMSFMCFCLPFLRYLSRLPCLVQRRKTSCSALNRGLINLNRKINLVQKSRIWDYAHDSLFHPAGLKTWIHQFKADAQKERSEKQAAVQAPGKRSHIDFSSSSTKDKGAQPPLQRKSRFQPYGVPGIAAPREREKERQKTRWG
ncbi:hypothetical protein GALMADRAFT_154027 [Galerina marginata CBS 339.88]|uniref:Uncharacterized protein n=1 Tax=Galerina marginata (strain CBS 339.88) TaxID=685588 RepID=A0A067TDI5_GALM3|nr:hypothetical protein GALMADRAFT_154027 [Galerina marginata CBS 339.88]